MIAATHLLKGIRYAHTIIRLPPPAPSHMGGGCALLRVDVPPDGGGKFAQVVNFTIRNSLHKFEIALAP